jgi:hypothetical protein
VAERAPTERDLAILRYLRAHEEATAAANAEAVLAARAVQKLDTCSYSFRSAAAASTT